MIERNELIKVSTPWLLAIVIFALFTASGVMLSACKLGVVS